MDQSALQMVLQAGYVVKCILIILLIFSVTSWTIIFYKWRLFSKSDDENATFMNIYNVSKSPKDLYTSSKKFKLSPLARLFKSVYSEKAYTDKQELRRMLKRYGALESALSRHNRFDDSLYRSLRNGVGNHERFHRNRDCRISITCCCRSWNRRSACHHGDGASRGHPCRNCLQLQPESGESHDHHHG